MTDFEALTLDELRRRRSAKWSAFGPDVLPAWIAEMDVPLAPPIAAVLSDAIARGDVGYAYDHGIGAAFAAFARARWGWTVEPRDVLLAPDVLWGISEVLRALTAPGARVVVNSPVYAPFYRTIREVGRTIDDVPLVRGEQGWSLDLAGLERAFAAGAQAYVLCSPHNPLGRIFPTEELARVAELAQRYGVVTIADEIHAPLTAPDETFTPFLTISAAAGCEHALALSSASKAWNLPGLKCSIIVAGSSVMRERLRALPAELPSKCSILGTFATVAAFREGGAWLDCGALGLGVEPVDLFRERGRVALSRGRDFGEEGRACVRLNFGTTSAILRELVARMDRALAAPPAADRP